MSYNLKNKIAVLMAGSCIFALTVSPVKAEDIKPETVPPAGAAALNSPENALITPAASSLDFLEEAPAEATAPKQDQAPAQAAAQPNSDAPAKAGPNRKMPKHNRKNGLLNETSAAGVPTGESAAKPEEAIPATEAPKSPFESFGNSILSKVDNDLFNQMSDIEKQNTLLNLELKREDLKNRVEALRVARIRAQQEEDARIKAEQEKEKDREVERQKQVLSEQQKLKQKEIELEKVRQSKVLNEYMNEMLVMNQKWVEKNSALQAKVRTLQAERISLINEFEKKIAAIQTQSSELKNHVQSAVETHKNRVDALNSQIESLQQSVLANENTIKEMREGNSANPFADDGSANIDKNAVDMSQEYAIMDITGKGSNVVAKIVSKDGTTFMVRKGSMLKGGEVVTSITDHYIAFENKGIKSYLYTGGTVVNFEPTATFNGSDKTPEETVKNTVKSEIKNVLGNNNQQTAENTGTASAPKEKKAPRPVSSAQGMFVQ